MIQNEGPFSVKESEGLKESEEGILRIICNLPLIYLAGASAGTVANKLASRLNAVFKEMYPELVESAKEADRLQAAIAKRKWSWHMYLAVKAVLETQRNNGQGQMNWLDIYHHPDFRFPYAIGSVLGKRSPEMHKVRKAIQGAVIYLQSKGVDIEVDKIPGKGLYYRLC